MKPFEVQILTPNGSVFNGTVTGIKLPGTEGNFEVLYNHASLMSGLEVGVITIKNDSKVDYIAVSGGFVEVNSNKVTVLAESAEPKEEIDLQRALESKKRAEERLAAEKKNAVDQIRAELALSRAMNRIKVAQQ
ncbi:MAG TPA: F0F1 ATP synthase subunit epsilon [Bacteroidetes bacterium]|nr:F0F1 ATP synthase subunit epsilon [Bacteroidota bacterium]